MYSTKERDRGRETGSSGNENMRMTIRKSASVACSRVTARVAVLAFGLLSVVGCSALCEEAGPVFCPGWAWQFFWDMALSPGSCSPYLYMRLELLDAETETPVTDAAVGGKTFTEGELTASVNPLTSGGIPTFPPPADNGSCELLFSEGSLTPCPPPEFTRPDQVEVVVLGRGCVQTFVIDINEQTVVDMDFPDDVIELKDPILVPSCGD